MKKNIVIVILVLIVFIETVFILASARRQNHEQDKTAASSYLNTEATNDSEEKSYSSSEEERTNSLGDQAYSSNVQHLAPELQEYSDEQIEYARVWLAIMGEDYLEKINGDFNLNVTFRSKGSYVYQVQRSKPSPYEVKWQEDVVLLTGNSSVQGQIFYSSNHDGTITHYYQMPSHWHLSEEQFADIEFMNDYITNIIVDTKTVSIPVGDSKKVREIIELEKIYH